MNPQHGKEIIRTSTMKCTVDENHTCVRNLCPRATASDVRAWGVAARGALAPSRRAPHRQERSGGRDRRPNQGLGGPTRSGTVCLSCSYLPIRLIHESITIKALDDLGLVSLTHIKNRDWSTIDTRLGRSMN